MLRVPTPFQTFADCGAGENSMTRVHDDPAVACCRDSASRQPLDQLSSTFTHPTDGVETTVVSPAEVASEAVVAAAVVAATVGGDTTGLDVAGGGVGGDGEGDAVGGVGPELMMEISAQFQNSSG